VRLKTKSVLKTGIVCLALSIALNLQIEAQDAHFHNAPSSSTQEKNPYAGERTAIAEGAELYTRNCGACHGIGGRGTGNIPALSHGAVQSAADGEVFWVFVSDQRAKAYVVLTGKNGIRLPENVLDRIGVPGVLVTGRLVEGEGVKALAVDSLER
jgi:hypothetical protein